MSAKLKSTQSRVKKGSDTTIVIGIDFGTTFTGVAWLSSKRPDNIHTITGWENPSCENGDTAKVPSKLYYDDDALQLEKVTYGYATPTDKEAIEWFKLLLLRESDLPSILRHSVMLRGIRLAIQKAGKQPVEVAGDYLGKIWNCALGQIEAQFGRGFVAAAKIQVVMTHPAIWSPKSGKQLREAVKIAGISKSGTEVSYLAEPEAAALATLVDKDGCDLELGDRFIVVDCGGGTVDITSYAVLNPDPMRMKECIRGVADLCGAKLVDNNFEFLLKSKFGSLWDLMSTETRQALIKEHWEDSLKRRFSARRREVRAIRVPWDVVDEASRAGKTVPKAITLYTEDIESVFQPAFERIEEMITGQIDGIKQQWLRGPKVGWDHDSYDSMVSMRLMVTASSISLLAGGFGRCSFLYETLRDRYDTEGTLEVLKADGELPWTAICRGAVIHGLSLKKIHSTAAVDVESRVARASYGVAFDEAFNSNKHAKKDRILKGEMPVEMATNQMRWFLRQGQDVGTKRAVTARYKQLLGKIPTTVKHTIYSSTREPPPRRVDDTVEMAAEMEWSWSLDYDKLPIRIDKSTGKELREVEWEYRMTCEGTSLVFEVYYKNKRHHSELIPVDFRGEERPTGQYLKSVLDESEESEESGAD